jgi:hypothetical protein
MINPEPDYDISNNSHLPENIEGAFGDPFNNTLPLFGESVVYESSVQMTHYKDKELEGGNETTLNLPNL